MAVPNYTYLNLKMPGPNGIITIGSAYQHAYECDVACIEYAEALFDSAALVADLERLSKEMPDPKRHTDSFELAEEVKLAPLCVNDPNGKVLKVSAALDPNRKPWGPSDTLGILREVAEHSLDI
jgi:rhamnose utilization protein RhaD (predicted bifunctional aldolase and dehydrogenase)